ncbi:MAG: orotate phosphoribosyltransferase, partial [Planctomycetota bacterium]
MNRKRLEELVRACVHRGEVTLASGKKSDFYVDGRLVTLTPEGSRLLGEELLDLVQELRVSALAGPTTGACPLVSATGVLAAQAGVPLKLAYVRGAPKGHGLQKRIEGPPL